MLGMNQAAIGFLTIYHLANSVLYIIGASEIVKKTQQLHKQFSKSEVYLAETDFIINDLKEAIEKSNT